MAVKIMVGFIVILLCAEAYIRLLAWILERNRSFFEMRDGVNNIYCIGDSFTFGTGIKETDTWPSVLRHHLKKKFPGTYEVINAGRPGSSSSYALYLVAKIIDKGNPALLIVLSGWNANNNDFRKWRQHYSMDVSLTARINETFEVSRLYCFIKWALTAGKRTIELEDIELVPMSYQMDLYSFRAYQEICRDNLQKLARLCRQNNVPLLLLNYPYQKLPENSYGLDYEYYHLLFGRSSLVEDDYIVSDRRSDEMGIHSVIRKVAEEEKVQYLDLHRVFQEKPRADLYQEDWHHPTTTGHYLIGKAVYKRLEQSIKIKTVQ